MLSINIPVYNIVVDDLVLQLRVQAEKLNIRFEIRVYDDGSTEDVKRQNRELSGLKNVIYLELKENLGRAAIRNKLGSDSNFALLLFIDADSKVINENYLETYLKNWKNNCVLCGGTSYSEEKPRSDNKLLRWKYGVKREAISAEIRNSQKGFIITSNNFMLEKRVFEEIPFREEIRDYGHEDTLLGFDLFTKGVEIRHIDNPVEHTGLEEAAIFLEKSRSALKNLYLISENMFDENEEFRKQVRFLDRYRNISRFLLPVFLRFFFNAFSSVIESNLKGKCPSLFWFDVYKLSYFSTIKKP